MPINRNQMTPLSKGGARTVHAGKGSMQAPMAARAALTNAPPTGPTLNNYAKATPMANPQPAPMGMMGVPPGIGG
jgi:hypothetical protein